MSPLVSRNSRLWVKYRGVWLHDNILKGQTSAETGVVDHYRPRWEVPSPDTKLLVHTFVSFKEVTIVIGNVLCIALKEQEQVIFKLWCEYYKFLWDKKHWKMPCLLRKVETTCLWWCGRTGKHFQLLLGLLWVSSPKSVWGLLCSLPCKNLIIKAGMH